MLERLIVLEDVSSKRTASMLRFHRLILVRKGNYRVIGSIEMKVMNRWTIKCDSSVLRVIVC